MTYVRARSEEVNGAGETPRQAQYAACQIWGYITAVGDLYE